MKYLGIDYGKKRIGLALSDEEGKIAFPRTQLTTYNAQLTTKIIGDIIKKEGVEKIVVGVPVTFGGKESAQTVEARAFGEKLQKAVQLPVEYENELLTTKMALKGGVAKNKVDAASAAILLQSYLDKLN
ncbi:MAG: Holliday junction resolvase RuvX [bacterium]|nr:Holliday junction resolvase RuvX [bacterium]